MSDPTRAPFGFGRWAAGIAVLGMLAFVGASGGSRVMLVVTIGSMIVAPVLALAGAVLAARAMVRGEPGTRRLLGAIAAGVVVIGCGATMRNFARYGLRSKSSEARTVLGGIKTQQGAFREERGFYVSAGSNPKGPPGMSKRRWDTSPCPSACAATRPEACQSFECLGYRPSGDVYYQYTCTATATDGVHDFTCVAAGDLDADGDVSVFVYGTANRTGATRVVVPIPQVAPLGDCADGDVAPGTVVECTPGVD